MGSHRTEHQSPRSGPCRESAGMNAVLLPKDTADSDEASADAGAGAARGGLSSKLRAAAERGESQGSDDASSTPRGRPKSKPSAVPPRELVRAAAQELVSMKNSHDGVGSKTDPFK